jgi:hypothetical protein
MNKSKNNVNRDRDVNYRDKNNNFIKRCGYLLAAMKISDFIKLGGYKIDNSELYYIEKKYDGTPTGEACAILGIRKKELLELIKSSKSITENKSYLNNSLDNYFSQEENKEDKSSNTINDCIDEARVLDKTNNNISIDFKSKEDMSCNKEITSNQNEKKREIYKENKSTINTLNKIDKIYEIRDNKIFKIEDKNGNILYYKEKDDKLLKDILSEKKTETFEHYNRYENLNEDNILYLNKNSENEENILNIIKNFNKFNTIDNIKNLNIDNIIDPVIHFLHQIIHFEGDDYLFIFNIEPKGQTKRQLKYYPNPNICIPGGNMEKKDLLSYELCAIREFEEETGIKIRNNYDILMTYNIQIKKYKSNKELNSFKSNLKNNRRSVQNIHYQDKVKYIEKSCSFPTSTFFKRFDFKDIKYQYERHYFFVKIN